MKDTGIVRRIDELGRIVIPKEMRRVLRLNVGTQMEIYTNDQGELILKKYSAVNEMKDFATIASQALSDGERGVLVCDTDIVLACHNVGKKDYLNKPISAELEKLMFDRKNYLLNIADNTTTYAVVNGDKNTYSSQIVVPIVVSSDVVGAIVVVQTNKTEPFVSADVKVVSTVANLLANLLE